MVEMVFHLLSLGLQFLVLAVAVEMQTVGQAEAVKQVAVTVEPMVAVMLAEMRLPTLVLVVVAATIALAVLAALVL